MKFGADGTLYCNSIKYNYKQARNIVYNNCDGHGNNDGWSTSNVGAIESVHGYKSWKCFKFTKSSNPIMRQSSFAPTANHKYYGSVMWQTPNSSFSTGDCRFEWWCNDNSTGKLTFANMNTATSGNWVKLSSIQSISSVDSGTWVIRLFLTNPTSDAYVCKMIIVDLTDTFGSGHEPSKAWCDANILEHDKLCSTACYSITSSSNSGWDAFGSYGWSGLNSNWEPRDSMQCAVSSTSSLEGTQSLSVSGTLTNTNTYYASLELNDSAQYFLGKMNYQFYYPIAEPFLGNQKPILNRLSNGGGGMKDWKRIGVMNGRQSFSDGSYQFRFDLDNVNYYRTIRICNQNLFVVDWAVNDYNTWFGTSISVGDVNKEWCDRWLEGRNSPIIHIKDPEKLSIVIRKPMQEIKKAGLSFTKAQADNMAGASYSWDGITDASKLNIGELACVSFTETTNNKQARFISLINSTSGTTVNTTNYGWGYSDFSTADNANAVTAWYQLANGYDIECNDIEIRPEINYISFDTTGTIKCKKLVTEF